MTRHRFPLLHYSWCSKTNRPDMSDETLEVVAEILAEMVHWGFIDSASIETIARRFEDRFPRLKREGRLLPLTYKRFGQLKMRSNK